MSNDTRTGYDRASYPSQLEESKVSLDDLLEQVRYATREKCREVIELRRAVLTNTAPQIIAAGQALARAFARQATLFAFGNGGSATDAQSLVMDLLHPPFPHWRPLPALALHESAVIMAVGHDAEREHIFARQIIAFGRSGDIALAFATHGHASHLLAALEQAKRQEMLTIALVGSAEGAALCSPVADFCLSVPGEHNLRIQEVQATISHTLLEIIHACIESRPPARTRRSAMFTREKRTFLLDIH